MAPVRHRANWNALVLRTADEPQSLRRIDGGKAMAGVVPMDLVVLADDEGNSVCVKVLGRHPDWSAGLAAEIVVQTPFVSGRIDLVLSASKLEAWADALAR